ncbi:ABC transporter substrate-binding protein [Paenibacillus sp. ACRRY]|uniref:ABC transporter substrate-binding protein n=1 Tax=Paenibacillus sp. ACRRY TaxID=2918208 RepID=UPI001EF4E1BB|nr:ABC transporter substrate-binding protein [Paenibacillus sp. ACRRY]MCG7384395.1 ABC transporter substrate-binding protein [Paenibacillus sp. ACRRY]
MQRKGLSMVKMLFLILLVAMLAACGTTNTATTGTGTETETVSSGNNEEQAASVEAEDTESATHVIDTPNGELELPVNPKRIVVDGYLPNLLSLGVKPVGATKWELENKVIQDQIDGIADIGERSLEAILSLEPDLIITWVNPAADAQIIEQYEKIAPTLVIPYNHFPDIHENMRYFGSVFGKEAEAEAWLADLDQVAADAREQIKPYITPEDTFALMGVFVADKNFYVYGNGGYRGGEAIYTHLQLNPPEKQRNEIIGKETNRQISYEVVGEYAGDYIFLDQGEMLPEVWGSNEGVWKTLDAVKNNRVFQLDPDLFWGNDPISLKLQIQEIAKMIVEREQSNQKNK